MIPAMSHIRVYVEPEGYLNRVPYVGFLTVMHLTDKIVYLMGAVGVVNRETWNKSFELLRSKGITTVMMERRGKMRTIHLESLKEIDG